MSAEELQAKKAMSNAFMIDILLGLEGGGRSRNEIIFNYRDRDSAVYALYGLEKMGMVSKDESGEYSMTELGNIAVKKFKER
jgi:predicted transcriptional regulator